MKAFESFADSPPDLGSGRVPTDFTTESVVLCTVRDDAGATPVSDQRTPATGFERRGSDPADVRAVLDYLALPSQSRPDPGNTACPAMAETDPWLFLLDATGRWIQPAIPRDPCGFSRGTFDGTPVPYTTMTFTDTAVCRVPSGGSWRCEQ